MPNRTVAICSNTSWYVYKFRSNLISTLIKSNFDVHVISPTDQYTQALLDLGCRHSPVSIESASRNPLADLRLLVSLSLLMQKIRPYALLNFTARPNIFASCALFLRDGLVINNVAGLGSGFVQNTLMTRLLELMYRTAFLRANIVFFQNPDDRDYFLAKKIVSQSKVRLLPGSGVDLERFEFLPRFRAPDEPIRFLFIGRLIRSKGVLEAAEAIQKVNEGGRNVILDIVGVPNVDSRDALTSSELEELSHMKNVQLLGYQEDVLPAIKASDCLVLPSYYREGTPRSILEALAVGRPVITTDMPGCRQTVNGKNGYLVPPKETLALAGAMASFADLNDDARREMGIQSRCLCEKVFDEKIVLREYLNALN